MSKTNWLNTSEYLFIAAAIIGTVATGVTNKAIYAAAPLSVALSLNAINQQVRDKKIAQQINSDVSETEQRLLSRFQSVEDTLQALPPPPEPIDLTEIEEKIHRNQGAIAQFQERISQAIALENLLNEVQKTISLVEKDTLDNKEAISQVQQEIQSLPTRAEVESLTQEPFSTLLVQQKSSEDAIATIREQINAVSSRTSELSNWSESVNFNLIQQNLSNLNDRINNLHAQFSNRLELGEIESLKTTLESGITRSELNMISEDLEKVKEQKQSLENTIDQLQKAFKQLPPVEEIEQIKEKLDRVDVIETLEKNHISHDRVEVTDLHDIEGEIAHLKTQLTQMQQQLTNRQNTFNELDEPQKPITDSPRLKKLLSWFNDKF